MADALKKIKFIMFWYQSQSGRFDVPQKLELLRKWIETCVKYEEYEMAASLMKERCIIMRQYRIKTGGIARKLKRILTRVKYAFKIIRNFLSWQIRHYFFQL